jgi:glutathione S-transferase
MSALLKATRRLGSVAQTFNPALRNQYSAMASKPIMLYTAGTPNGRKVNVFLEELKVIVGAETQ